MLCCLRLNMEDAIKMGDGKRLMLCYKFMYLYCKESGHDKYAYGLLETVAQSSVLLTPRTAENLVWNRFVNTQGDVDSNFPIDLYVEHQNLYLKRDVKTFRGDITDKTMTKFPNMTSNPLEKLDIVELHKWLENQLKALMALQKSIIIKFKNVINIYCLLTGPCFSSP